MLSLSSIPSPIPVANSQQKKMRQEEEEEEEEDHTNWFSHWEHQLPSPEELTPLTQTLITPDLAIAFDITPIHTPPSSTPPPEFLDSPGQDEPARTLKRPRLVWTPQLHKRFVDAVAHLGIKNAVPKTIMQLMSVDGLTRENVASHLQKYRLYLKRMQGLSGGGGAGISVADAASDRLFASAPVPHQFLHRGGGPAVVGPPVGGGGGEHYVPFVSVTALQHHHHHHQMAAAVAAAQQQRQMGCFGSPPGGQFDHGFLARQHRMVGGPVPAISGSGYVEDLELGGGGGGRKVLTLFPTGDD